MECVNCPYLATCNGNCVIYPDSDINFRNWNNLVTQFSTNRNFLETLKRPDKRHSIKLNKINLDIKK